jgi:hypothetical protein
MLQQMDYGFKYGYVIRFLRRSSFPILTHVAAVRSETYDLKQSPNVTGSVIEISTF